MDNSSANKSQPDESPQPVTQPPQGEPVPSQQPDGPVGYQMPPKKSMSKGMLWGIIGGAVGLVILVVAVILIVVLLGGPTKEDYRRAVGYMGELNINEEVKLNDAKTGTEAKEMIDSFVKKADDHFDKLRSDKVMRDSEVKELFDKYDAEWKKAKPVLLEISDIADMTYSFSKECRNSSFISYIDKTGEAVGKEFDAEHGSCMKLLDKFKSSSDKTVAEYSKAQYDYLKGLRAYTVAMAERYSSKDYTSPLPKYPEYPTAKNPGMSIYEKTKNIKLDDYEKDFLKLLKKKADD